MNTHHENVVHNRTKTSSITRSVSLVLIATFAICVLSCAQNCAAQGPLIKPAKWGLKWPWQKKKAAESVDPFNALGADQQRALATSITGVQTEIPKYSPPAIQAVNGHAPVPGAGSNSKYPWPPPVDSKNASYNPQQPPTGDLYNNPAHAALTAAAGLPSRPVLSTPAQPAQLAPSQSPIVQPARNNGSLYPQTARSRVAGTSVTVPTPHPTAWGTTQPPTSNVAGALYPNAPHAGAPVANPAPSAIAGTTIPTITPNYARPVSPTPERMRVTTISPSTGRSRSIEIQDTAQQVAATGPAVETGLNSTRQPNSSRLLPNNNYAKIEAEPIVPRKPIVPPQPSQTPVQSVAVNPVPRVSVASAGIPASPRVSGASFAQEGPYFDPETRPNYDDQYGWQTGTVKSSRKSWSGNTSVPGTTRAASATESEKLQTPVIPAAPVTPTVLPTQAATPPKSVEAATDLPPAPTSPAPAATPNPAPAAPTSPSGLLPLPLPPLTKAAEQIQENATAAVQSLKSATAAVGGSISNVGSRVQQASHAAVESTVNQAQQAAGAVLNTPVDLPAAPVVQTAGGIGIAGSPGVPQQPAVRQVDMTSVWQPGGPSTTQAAPATNIPAAPLTYAPTNTVAPATPDPRTAPPVRQTPQLDGSFSPADVDQSIWGNQQRPRRPAPTVQPAVPTNRVPHANIQATRTEPVPAPKPGALVNNAAPRSTPPPNPALGDLDQASQVVAIVGDQSILAGDLLWQINQMLKPYIGKAPEAELNQQRALMMEKMLPRLVENKLVYLDFLRTIPPGKMPEIQKQVGDEFNKSKLPELMKKAKVKSQAEMDAKLRDLGSSLSKQQQMFLEQIVGRQMVQQNVDARSEVTHDELLKYYHKHADEFALTARARWECLTVRWDQFPSRKEAESALAKLGNDVLRGAKFGEVAKRGSQCPRASEGGFYDWTERDSLKSAEIDKAIFTLPVGRMSKMIQNEDGAHIVRVVERREAGRTPFDSVQSKITDAIQEERFRTEVEAYLAKLKQQTTVWTAFDQKP